MNRIGTGKLGNAAAGAPRVRSAPPPAAEPPRPPAVESPRPRPHAPSLPAGPSPAYAPSPARTGPLPPPVFSRGQNAYGAPSGQKGGSGGPKSGSGGPKSGSGGPKSGSGGPKSGSGGPKRANELLFRLGQMGEPGKPAKGGAKADAKAIKKAFGELGQQPGERIAGFLSLDGKARKAYIKLPERERRRVDRLLQAVEAPTGDAAKLAHAAIENLLRNKVFQPTKASKKGPALENKVLAQLDARLGKPLAPELAAKGLDSGDVTQQIVTALAFPGWVFQGKGTATCVPASLETILAKTAPDEYVRVAGGLLWDGQVQLRGGKTLELSTSELGMADGGRGSVHQLLQGSMLRLGQQLGEATGDEDPYGRGRYGRAAVYGSGTYATGGEARVPAGTDPAPAAETPPAGLTGLQASLLYEQVVGDPAVPFKVTDANRKEAWSMVKAAVNALGSASVGVATVNAEGKRIFHEITVTKIGEEKVEIADSGLGNSRMIPIKHLKADLTSVIVPASFLAGQTQRVDERGEGGRPWVGKMVGSLQAGRGRRDDDADLTGPAYRRTV